MQACSVIKGDSGAVFFPMNITKLPNTLEHLLQKTSLEVHLQSSFTVAFFLFLNKSLHSFFI